MTSYYFDWALFLEVGFRFSKKQMSQQQNKRKSESNIKSRRQSKTENQRLHREREKLQKQQQFDEIDRRIHNELPPQLSTAEAIDFIHQRQLSQKSQRAPVIIPDKKEPPNVTDWEDLPEQPNEEILQPNHNSNFALPQHGWQQGPQFETLKRLKKLFNEHFDKNEYCFEETEATFGQLRLSGVQCSSNPQVSIAEIVSLVLQTGTESSSGTCQPALDLANKFLSEEQNLGKSWKEFERSFGLLPFR
jgi:hypothetical protein